MKKMIDINLDALLIEAMWLSYIGKTSSVARSIVFHGLLGIKAIRKRLEDNHLSGDTILRANVENIPGVSSPEISEKLESVSSRLTALNSAIRSDPDLFDYGALKIEGVEEQLILLLLELASEKALTEQVR